MWDHDKESKLSYYRLISRSGGLTAEMKQEKEELETEFKSLGFGEFPGGVDYIRYCREQTEKKA